MKTITAVALTLATLATPLAAQDSFGLTFSGDIRIEHSMVGSDDQTFLIGTGDLNLDFGNGFGIAASAESYVFDTDTLAPSGWLRHLMATGAACRSACPKVSSKPMQPLANSTAAPECTTLA